MKDTDPLGGGRVSDLSRRQPCQSAGCNQFAVWVITKGKRTKKVCSSCRDEMTVAYGWFLSWIR